MDALAAHAATRSVRCDRGDVCHPGRRRCCFRVDRRLRNRRVPVPDRNAHRGPHESSRPGHRHARSSQPLCHLVPSFFDDRHLARHRLVAAGRGGCAAVVERLLDDRGAADLGSAPSQSRHRTDSRSVRARARADGARRYRRHDRSRERRVHRPDRPGRRSRSSAANSTSCSATRCGTKSANSAASCCRSRTRTSASTASSSARTAEKCGRRSTPECCATHRATPASRCCRCSTSPNSAARNAHWPSANRVFAASSRTPAN